MVNLIYHSNQPYTGVWRTPALVGREAERAQVIQTIRDTHHSCVIYITAQGGIGKTRLLEDLLQHPPTDALLKPACRLIDLYHTRFHTLSGLVTEMLEILNISDEPMSEAEQTVAKTAQLEAAGVALNSESRRMLTDWFVARFNAFTAHQPVLLALDTMERIRVTDPTQAQLGLTAVRVTILDWLVEDFLPQAKNAVIILAGRPPVGGEEDRLKSTLQKKLGKRFNHLELQGLTEEETLTYFEEVVKSADTIEDVQEKRAIKAIKELNSDRRRAIFYCLCDGEAEPFHLRPILLALAIDHLIVSGESLAVFGYTLEKARQLSPAQRRETQMELGWTLVNSIRENYRLADELILALAWLRKGATVELLAGVAGYEPSIVESVLDQLKKLSFVKIRPSDDRIFLHDEMYDLLEQFGLDMTPGPRSARVFRTVGEYYRPLIKQSREELDELFKEALYQEEKQGGITPLTLLHKRALWQDGLAEEVYYQLRKNAREGFDTYFRYAEEAMGAHNLSLYMQLQAELLDFWPHLALVSEAEEGDGLKPGVVLADFALRWLKRLIVIDEDQKMARRVIQRLRGQTADLITQGDDLAAMELDIWEGHLLTAEGKLAAAEALLKKAKSELDNKRETEVSRRLSAILAQAYTFLGYLYRSAEQFRPAADMYKDAIPYWRHADIRSELARVLNRQAFVMGQFSYYDTATRLLLDGLVLRQKQGLKRPVAESYNVWATINIWSGNYEEARDHAQMALRFAQETDYGDAEGLAYLALAEIYRFESERPGWAVEQRLVPLNEALRASEKALDIFTTKVKDQEREAEAYYSRGCTYRELCRISEEGEEKEAYFRQAEEALRRASQKNKGRPLAQLEDEMSLAWLYYYAGQQKQLQVTLGQAKEIIQDYFADYKIEHGNVLSFNGDKSVRVFEQLVRLHVLTGMQAMATFEQVEGKAHEAVLRQAAEEFTLALEYSRYIPESQAVRRAIDNIMEKTRKLKMNELKVMFGQVRQVADRLGGYDFETREGHKPKLWTELENQYGPYKLIKTL